MIAKGLASTDHPVMAHIIPIRRCNLACKYCNEYDDFSKPVALEIMKQRIDHLARLGTTIVTLSGGEPLLHPQLDEIIAHMRTYPMLAGLITNGYLLNPERIKRLNQAGLDHLQISIDNVMPDDVSKKSLKVLDLRLKFLAEHADFHVNINSVVGAGTHNPHDALVVGRRAVQLGFTSTIGIIHDGDGQLQPLSDVEREVFLKMKHLEKHHYARFNWFQNNIAERQAQRVALPRRSALSLHLRRRLGALLLAAARLSGNTAGAVFHRRHPPRVPHRQELCSTLHRIVRPSGVLHGPLARPANHAHNALIGRCGPVSADRIAAPPRSSNSVQQITQPRSGGAGCDTDPMEVREHQLWDRPMQVFNGCYNSALSSVSDFLTRGRVAQLAEQLTLNQ